MTLETNSVIDARRAKVDALREAGTNPYPNDFKPSHSANALWDKYSPMSSEELGELTDTVVIAGRAMFIREFGKLAFVRLQDETGQIQCALSVDSLTKDVYDAFKTTCDVGDIIGVTGTMMRTQKGELSVKATSYKMITKSVRPLPEKWHGLTDKETRYRQRYVDLIVNKDTRDTFRKRCEIMTEIRRFYENAGFLEVETPFLHHEAGGTTAKPFSTHHNALDIPLNLRIALELHLKRLVVGGFERVFEMARVFRNEGISIKHNPEFTMLESYTAYWDADDTMDFVEALIKHLCQKVFETTKLTYGDKEIDFTGPWKRMSMKDALLTLGGAKEDDLKDKASMLAFAKSCHVEIEDWQDEGHVFATLFEELCESQLINPTYIYDHPLATSPLARTHDDDRSITQRAELFINGWEIANMYSELNDPADQAARFKAQVEEAAKGNDEAMPYDSDYIRALEHGMPPAGGIGIGIDRLVMLLTNAESIRDVIFFPLQKPENVGGATEETEDTSTDAKKDESAA
mgnify:CR=1 FL=1